MYVRFALYFDKLRRASVKSHTENVKKRQNAAESSKQQGFFAMLLYIVYGIQAQNWNCFNVVVVSDSIWYICVFDRLWLSSCFGFILCCICARKTAQIQEKNQKKIM